MLINQIEKAKEINAVINDHNVVVKLVVLPTMFDGKGTTAIARMLIREQNLSPENGNKLPSTSCHICLCTQGEFEKLEILGKYHLSEYFQ